MKNSIRIAFVFGIATLGLAVSDDSASMPANGATPTACGEIGTGCPDGTVYAGLSPDGRSALYTTPYDAPLLLAWNSGERDLWTETGTVSHTNGKMNTGLLHLHSAVGKAYRAANYCATLNASGRDDWYLPARDELSRLHENRVAIGNFNLVVGARYWSSSESTNLFAWSQNFDTGFQSGDPKHVPLGVRCVRKGPISPRV
jgi:hypothetical protein